MKTEKRSPALCSVIFLLLVVSILPLTAEAQQQFTESVEMPDGIVLATEVWLPAGTGPFPTVLMRTIFSRFGFGDERSLYLQNEYAVVIQQSRGFGQSGGDWYFWDHEPSDGHATIEWIAQQPWSDGKVGMVGNSNRGASQYAVAQNAPAALKCLAPAHESPDRYQHVGFPGGALFYDLVYHWMENRGFLHLLPDLLAHRLLDSWWDGMKWVASPEAIHVPMFHMGRWHDMFPQGPPHAFQVVQHQGGAGAAGNQYLLMDPLTHGSQYGQFSPLHPPTPIPFEDYRHQLEFDWLEYWLKDEANGVDDWPHVRLYLMGPWDEPGAPGNTWIEMDEWPPVAETRIFYLSQDGQDGVLGESIPSPGQLLLTIDPEFDPVPTYGGGNNTMPSGPWDQAAYPEVRPIESRDDVLTFTTDVLTEPTTVIGPVTAKIWINPDTPDLDLSLRLTDVYPDGRSILITDGIQRARMKCGDDIECFLTPGVPEEIEVEVGLTAMVFNAGHRIRLAIAGTNWERFERNSNDGGDLNNPNYIVANPEILFGPQYPSALYLPFPALFADGFESGNTLAWSAAVP
jgi:predicted acyl esterase